MAKSIKVEAQIRGSWTSQASKGFAEKDRGTTSVAPLQMQLGNRHLKDPLQAAPLGICRFVPELFKQIVGGVPLTGIEKLQGLLKAGIRLGHQRLDFAGFLPGSLRRRIDSGVTSSISSGPMYSRARSSVI